MRPWIFLHAALAVLVSACAHPETAADRHRAEQSDELTSLQAAQDKQMEALGANEASAPRAKGVGPGTAPRAVQLGDTESGESDDPNDPNARPEIKVTGTPSGRTTRLRSHEPEPSTGRADPAKVPAVDPDARKAYEGALTLVGEKKYDKALEALSAFLVKWPDHPYAENATYWRGECYFAQGQYQKALEQFEAVATKGLGNKAPDALLKIGISHEKLGATDRAREAFEKLRREHPKSEAARKIPTDARGPRGPKEK
jgi:tol-pal system protein YbgF